MSQLHTSPAMVEYFDQPKANQSVTTHSFKKVLMLSTFIIMFPFFESHMFFIIVNAKPMERHWKNWRHHLREDIQKTVGKRWIQVQETDYGKIQNNVQDSVIRWHALKETSE